MLRLVILFILVSSIVRAEDLIEISPEKYIAENPTQERKAIVNGLIHQFDVRREKGISQQEIESFLKIKDESYAYNLYKMHFQIVEQKLYASYLYEEWFPGIIKFLQKLVTKYKIEDVDFILWHCEKLMKEHQDIEDILFLFSKSNSNFEKNKFLFPDFFMMKDWDKLLEQIENYKTVIPWDKKEQKIYWRGMTTASYSDLPEREPAYYDINVIDKTPRFILVMQSKLYPEFINARFSEGIRMYKDKEAVKNLEVIFEKLNLSENKRVKEIEHLPYKYLISVDGNTAAWKRVPWIMSSNSVLVKQETDRIEWFYPALKRYVNYVPVNENLSDIFCQLEWMKKNDNKVRQISENAQKFIKNELMPENIEAHSVIILNEYSKLHKGAKIEITLPPAEETLKQYYLQEAEQKKIETEQKK